MCFFVFLRLFCRFENPTCAANWKPVPPQAANGPKRPKRLSRVRVLNLLEWIGPKTSEVVHQESRNLGSEGNSPPPPRERKKQEEKEEEKKHEQQDEQLQPTALPASIMRPMGMAWLGRGRLSPNGAHRKTFSRDSRPQRDPFPTSCFCLPKNSH